MKQPLSAVIFDPLGPALTVEDKAFFRDINPYGYILFARHCLDPKQVRRLVGELQELSGRARLPVLIDQEGGRVARLKPPHWSSFPPASVFSALAERNPAQAARAVALNARLMAHELRALGITVDCAPLADIPVAGAHDIIGDRAFGSDAAQVIALARAMSEGLRDGGIVTVLKHIPGHGRAQADSHEELPVVHTPLEILRATDFLPFKALSDLPMAMTAHVLYSAIDDKNPATVSPAAIRLIREELGFGGLLLSDDISMKALHGSLAQRAGDSLTAGCDVVLHCNGSLAEKQQVAQGLSALEGDALARAEAAMQWANTPLAFEPEAARAELAALFA